ncbi:hypothetical protein SMSP2_00100 [Limihaloglobus sulfuriphilus]|uniref:NHL repeat containing protein n=1 Tax=Limihaloglobus sulfuriphilus TaxID=1851148 RepID=A0A1Q2MAQ6_9BACT|nr:hypothetical protein [Limihaloglobus sulfuriphilus]AQQ69766.1 hypothetical protein SMSP2_00100 [Limihaloglobus sulfuriphilus]
MNKHAAAKTEIIVGILIASLAAAGLFVFVSYDISGSLGSGGPAEPVYDMQKYRNIDPELITHAEKLPAVPAGFKESRAIYTAPDGKVYICGDKAVRVFSSDLKFIEQINLDDTPTTLAVSQQGRIYICMGSYISVYDPQTQSSVDWPQYSDKSVLTSIDVYKEHVLAADAGSKAVLHYNKDGSFVRTIGEKNKELGISGFVIPSPYFDLAVAGDGLLRVVNPGRHRIEAYTLDGYLEFFWGEYSSGVTGFCGCCNPANFAILPDNSFVTMEKGIMRAKVYDPDGVFVGAVAGPGQFYDGYPGLESLAENQSVVFDIAAAADGRILILDTVNNIIRVFKEIER